MIGKWRKMAIEECMDAIIDYRGKTPRKTETGIPLITAKIVKNGRIEPPSEYIAEEDYESWMRRGIPKSGDVIITTEAPLGEVAQIGSGKFALAQRIITLRGKKELLDNTFLKFLMQSQSVQNQLASRESGTTVTGIKQSELRKISLFLPSLEEQRSIANILGALDDKIELNRKMNETLEAMARALFKSWFVDFDPVRAKMEGRDTGLPKEIADLFPDEFEDSELGEIPKGWKFSQLGKEASTVLGGTPARAIASYWGGTIPWINSGKVNEFRIIEPSEFITAEGLESSATKILPERTTVIAITGATLGQVSLTEMETCANQSVVGVIGTPKMPNEFIYLWVKEHVKDLIASQTGGAQQHINKNNVNELSILCPEENIISEFVKNIRSAFNAISIRCYESIALAKTREQLLPKLMSGELKVG